MLKKQVYLLAIIVSVVFVFLSCSSLWDAMSTVKITFDPDLPMEQSTVVTFDRTIKVLQYNGIDVKDKWYPNGSERINKVTLPAGSAAIVFSYSIYITEGGVTTVKRNNIELRFDFEAEKDYAVGEWILRGESKGFLQGNKWTYGIGVWNKFGDIGEKDKAIKSWELGET
jgi:hypothetical protein